MSRMKKIKLSIPISKTIEPVTVESLIKVTVESLIKVLLKYPMGWEVSLKDSNGKRLNNTTIYVTEPEGLGCLFG